MNRTTILKLIRWAGTLLGTALFVWLLARQDWAQVWGGVRGIPAWVLVFALLLYAFGMVCNGWRWWVLVRAQRITFPFFGAVKIVFTGAFLSNFLPSTIGGDGYRVLALLRYASSKTTSATSVAVDRALNVLTMASVLPFSWWTFGNLSAVLHNLASGSGAGLIGLVSQFERGKTRFFDSFRRWGRDPVSLAYAFAVSWLSVLVIFFAILQLALALGIQVSLREVMGINALVYLLTLLPVSVNGYGVREVVFTGLYVQVGATVEQATTLALLTRLMAMLVTLPGAFWLSHTFSTSQTNAHSS